MAPQRKRPRSVLSLAPLAALALAGCMTVVAPPIGDPYGVRDAAAVDTTLPTKPLTPLLADRVRLVTWNVPDAGSAPGASVTFRYPIWATVDGELKKFCQSYSAAQRPSPDDLQRRLEQLLGLHPGDGTGRSFITFEVDRAQLIRPCPDPAVDTTACRANFDRATLKAALDKDPFAARFLLDQMLLSYKTPDGYPFTRRGFTYDWSNDSDKGTHDGLSEYVTRDMTAVTIVAPPQAPAAYCAPLPAAP